LIWNGYEGKGNRRNEIEKHNLNLLWYDFL
jgi:hypothetical protein